MENTKFMPIEAERPYNNILTGHMVGKRIFGITEKIEQHEVSYGRSLETEFYVELPELKDLQPTTRYLEPIREGVSPSYFKEPTVNDIKRSVIRSEDGVLNITIARYYNPGDNYFIGDRNFRINMRMAFDSRKEDDREEYDGLASILYKAAKPVGFVRASKDNGLIN